MSSDATVREHLGVAMGKVRKLRAELAAAESLLRRWLDVAESQRAVGLNVWTETRAFLAAATSTPPATPPPTCGKNYGELPATCRRDAGHGGECGPGSEFEQAKAQFLAARARVLHLAKKERRGEDWDPEWDGLRFTGVAAPPVPRPLDDLEAARHGFGRLCPAETKEPK